MTNISRALLYQEDPELDGLKKIRETLMPLNIDPGKFIRTFSLEHFVKNMETDELRTEIPGLKAVFPQIKETLAITTALAQVKIADVIEEGSEPHNYWKDCWRIEQMAMPKLSLPKEDRADLVPSLGDLKATDNAAKKLAGGKIENVDFDVSDDKGYYSVASNVKRNWLKDNNFRALETHLKLLGDAFYFRMGEFLFAAHAAASGTTDTKANLDGTSATFLEAVINAIENKMPAGRYVPDTAIFHPADLYGMKVEQWGTAGPIPMISGDYVDRNGDNVRRPGMAAILGLKQVFVTPWATENTVLIYNKNSSYAVGLRQDLELEDFNDTLRSIVGSVLSMRFDSQEIFDKATYKITSF